jgi:chromosome segregation ATPase
MASTKRSTRVTTRTAAARSKAGSKTGTPRKTTGKIGTPRTRKTTTTPAGSTAPKPLTHAQQALDHAARTEKQLRATLKKHTKTINTAKDDLDARTADLKNLKSQLKTAKKARKQTATKLRTDAAAKSK